MYYVTFTTFMQIYPKLSPDYSILSPTIPPPVYYRPEGTDPFPQKTKAIEKVLIIPKKRIWKRNSHLQWIGLVALPKETLIENSFLLRENNKTINIVFFNTKAFSLRFTFLHAKYSSQFSTVMWCGEMYSLRTWQVFKSKVSNSIKRGN